jgi:hypothetical protein
MVNLFDIVKSPCDEGERIAVTMCVAQKNTDKRLFWVEM